MQKSSDEKCTPLQMAISKCRKLRDDNRNLEWISALIAISNELQALLPAERQFASECFEAGELYGGDLPATNEADAPNFDTYFSQYNLKQN